MRVVGIPCAGSAFAGRTAAGARSVEADVGEAAAGTGRRLILPPVKEQAKDMYRTAS